MIEIFGDFTRELPSNLDSLEIIFSASSDVIKKRWKNNRLSAYFVADYFSSFFPVDEDPERIREMKGAVSYVANELLENAMRYNIANALEKVKFGIYFLNYNQLGQDITVLLSTINKIDEKDVKYLQSYIHELLNSDPDELYITKIQQSLEDEGQGTSGLGLLTMINDYSAKLGWKFEKIEDVFTVTTMAKMQM
ncbi:MAG: DUF6272 family protein [Crocosphaera sp.]